MISFIERTMIVPEVHSVLCNVCGREVAKNAIGYFEDYLSLTKDWGFHSPFDGEAHEIELCVDCYTAWTKSFEIPPSVVSKHEMVNRYA